MNIFVLFKFTISSEMPKQYRSFYVQWLPIIINTGFINLRTCAKDFVLISKMYVPFVKFIF